MNFTKTHRNLGPLLVAVSLFTLSLISPDRVMAGDDGEARGNYGRMYDVTTVETVNGEIVAIEKIPGRWGKVYNLDLKMKTEKETITAHLGPGSYLDKRGFDLKTGDKITLVGSRVKIHDTPVLVVREVKKGDWLLKLRDENGVHL